MTLTATIPAARQEQANSELEQAGHGPNNFSVPLSQGASDNVTHYGFHAWDDSDFVASVDELDIASLRVLSNPGTRVNFDDHLDNQGLRRRPEQGPDGRGRK